MDSAGNPAASSQHGLVAVLRLQYGFATAMYPPCIRQEIQAHDPRTAP